MTVSFASVATTMAVLRDMQAGAIVVGASDVAAISMDDIAGVQRVSNSLICRHDSPILGHDLTSCCAAKSIIK